MKEWMDELVETMDGWIEFIGETSIQMVKYIGAIIILITVPVWYLPYKFFRKK